MTKNKSKPYLAWIAVCIIWGTTYLAIRIGVADLPPMLFAGLRWLFAGTVLIIYLKFKKYKLPERRDILPIAVTGIALLGFGNGLVVFGEQWVSSGLTALLITTTPFWMVGIQSAFYKDTKISFTSILGLVLGLAGVALIFGSHFEELLDTSYLIGALSIMGAVIAWATGSVFSKHKAVSVHPMTSAAVQMLIAGGAQTVLGFILGEASNLHYSSSGFLSFAYLTLIGSIFGYGSYIYAITNLPLPLVSTYAYINPLIAVFLGWFVLNERLDLIIFISALIIIAGVMLVKKGSAK
ncbi:MAG TPA: EamA family transporter [Ignavibacteriaceae bacterium]|nr:EamA family transporter [Ignavibacteriaceae bacterium]